MKLQAHLQELFWDMSLPERLWKWDIRPGSTVAVMLFGLTAPEDEVAVKPFALFKKEITLKTSYINPYTFSRALDLISSGKIDVSSMIYAKCPLEELPEILADTKKRTAGKYVIMV